MKLSFTRSGAVSPPPPPPSAALGWAAQLLINMTYVGPESPGSERESRVKVCFKVRSSSSEEKFIERCDTFHLPRAVDETAGGIFAWQAGEKRPRRYTRRPSPLLLPRSVGCIAFNLTGHYIEAVAPRMRGDKQQRGTNDSLPSPFLSSRPRSILHPASPR